MNQITTTAAPPPLLAEAIERVLIKGDLSALNEAQRLQYYDATCKSLGLNPLTRPFDFISFQGKTVLYANKGCTEQLRQIHGISIEIVSREKIGTVYVVTARARNKDGRCDESTGAVQLGNSADIANLFMKAETKAKRRVTLSICGLNMLDESEIEDTKKVSPGPAVVPLVDATPPKDSQPAVPPVTNRTLTEKQIKRYHAIRNKAGWTPEMARDYWETTYGKAALLDLSWDEYEKLCKFMEAHPAEAQDAPGFADGGGKFPFEP